MAESRQAMSERDERRRRRERVIEEMEQRDRMMREQMEHLQQQREMLSLSRRQDEVTHSQSRDERIDSEDEYLTRSDVFSCGESLTPRKVPERKDSTQAVQTKSYAERKSGAESEAKAAVHSYSEDTSTERADRGRRYYVSEKEVDYEQNTWSNAHRDRSQKEKPSFAQEKEYAPRHKISTPLQDQRLQYSIAQESEHSTILKKRAPLSRDYVKRYRPEEDDKDQYETIHKKGTPLYSVKGESYYDIPCIGKHESRVSEVRSEDYIVRRTQEIEEREAYLEAREKELEVLEKLQIKNLMQEQESKRKEEKRRKLKELDRKEEKIRRKELELQERERSLRNTKLSERDIKRHPRTTDSSEDDSSSDLEIHKKKTPKHNEKLSQFVKFSCFSGEEPKPKSEVTYEEWKYEVACIRQEREIPEYLIAQALRKSLRGYAKRVLLPLGISATIDSMLRKLERTFGVVATGESILQEFYTAKQKQDESVTSWALRLEEILQKAIDKKSIQQNAKDEMLRTKFWRNLRSERLKNATRTKFESAKDFETLLQDVRSEEYEIKVSVQHQPAVTNDGSNDTKLDLLLQKIESLEKEMKDLKTTKAQEAPKEHSSGGYQNRNKNWRYRGQKHQQKNDREENESKDKQRYDSKQGKEKSSN